jgi:uncharacterized protein
MRRLKFFAVTLSFAFAFGLVAAQQPAHDPMTSMLPDAPGTVPWSVMSKTAIKRTGGQLGPDFPQPLRAFDGKLVKLQGYVMPLEPGQRHQRFLLSAWSPSCPFCLTAGPEAMVEVIARVPVAYSLEPVVVRGRFELLANDAGGLFFRLRDAEPATLDSTRK